MVIKQIMFQITRLKCINHKTVTYMVLQKTRAAWTNNKCWQECELQMIKFNLSKSQLLKISITLLAINRHRVLSISYRVHIHTRKVTLTVKILSSIKAAKLPLNRIYFNRSPIKNLQKHQREISLSNLLIKRLVSLLSIVII